MRRARRPAAAHDRLTAPFGARLAAAMDAHGPLCVGIDPHPSLLEAWGLPDDAVRAARVRADGARGGRRAGRGGQAAGRVLRAARLRRGRRARGGASRRAGTTGTLVIVDAKRGDIGSTMGAYADAFLRDGSPLAGDALTVSPYLGFGSLDPAVDLALVDRAGVCSSCASPPTRRATRSSTPAPRTASRVAALVAARAAALNAGADPLGSSGSSWAPPSATRPRAPGVDLAAVNGPLLAPGVGAQGAGPRELAQVFGAARRQVLASSSRGVLAAGPDVAALRAAARRASDEAAAALS